MLHLDYETRSTVDLKNRGAYNYASDPSTEIICLAWATDEDEPQIWHPGLPFPKDVLKAFQDDEIRSLHAHNANFERLITKYVLPKYTDLQQPSIDAWYCTASQARARALPASLDDLGACLGLKIKKDKRGKELINLLCIPKFQDDGLKRLDCEPPEDLLNEMYDYCLRDVVVERAAATQTPPLTDDEHDDWVVNEMVNDAGLRVDTEFATAATEYAEAELEELCEKIKIVSKGEITSPKQNAKLKEYLLPIMESNEDIRNAMTVVRSDPRTGEHASKISLDRDARKKLLQLEEAKPGTLPANIVEIIKLIEEAGRSSVIKFKNMSARASDDGRVRGAYVFSGAGQTGRFSSWGLQVHNLPRVCADDPNSIRNNIIKKKPLTGVMDTLSSMLRPSVVASEGHKFVCGDWASIEARILPWLADTEGGDDVLDVIENNDANPDLPDLYKVAASGLYGIDPAKVTKDQRQIGKVIILSSGYQGGYRAFQAMARAYQVKVSDDQAGDIIRAWRSQNQWATDFWRELDRAAKDAVQSPGIYFRAGRLSYIRPSENAPLYCELPSGRMLSYPFPRLDTDEEGRWVLAAVKASRKPRQGENEWGRFNLYGGLLAENATQAAAACLLRYAMGQVLDEEWPLVGHTHDEILLEVKDETVEAAVVALERIMLKLPEWAEDLPMAAEIWSGERYKK